MIEERAKVSLRYEIRKSHKVLTSDFWVKGQFVLSQSPKTLLYSHGFIKLVLKQLVTYYSP